MILKDLLEWLEQQDKSAVVTDGFGEPHTDRGYYTDLAFDPVKKTTFGEMLFHAKRANGERFEGYKGGDFLMHDYTKCKIGEWGISGEEITSAHLKLWLLTAKEQ